MRNATPYDPELNPFGEEDEDNTASDDKAEEPKESQENTSLNPFGDDFDDEDDVIEDIDKSLDSIDKSLDSINKSIDSIDEEPPKTPPLPKRVSMNPFLTASIKKKAAPPPPKPSRLSSNLSSPTSPESDQSLGEGHSVYANVETTDGKMVTSDSKTTTSGSANEQPADMTDAPPITIVSVCL